MLVDSNKRPRPSDNAGWLTKRSLTTRKTSLQPPPRGARDIALSRRRVAKSWNRASWKRRRRQAAPKSARRSSAHGAPSAPRNEPAASASRIHRASCRRAFQGCVARYVRGGVVGEGRRARRGSERLSVTRLAAPSGAGRSRHGLSCLRARREDDSSFRVLGI